MLNLPSMEEGWTLCKILLISNQNALYNFCWTGVILNNKHVINISKSSDEDNTLFMMMSV